MQRRILTRSIFGAIGLSVLLVICGIRSYAGETGCITTPGANTGKCLKSVEGIWNCTVSAWYQSNDCSASGS